MPARNDCTTCDGTGFYLMGEALPERIQMTCVCTLGECDACSNIGCLSDDGRCETCVEENSELFAVALSHAIERYSSRLVEDHDGDRYDEDEYGYDATARKAFVAGALWAGKGQKDE